MAKEALAGTEKIHRTRLKRHGALGMRWLRCGWRQLRRYPWLLGGMGLSGSFFISVLLLIPLVGRPVVALLAPIFLASAYLAIGAATRQKMPLPPGLRLAAFKQSPRELLGVFRNEERVVPILLVSLSSLTVALVVDALALLAAGNAWSKPWGSLDVLPLLTVLITTLFLLAIYFLLAASLIYTLPLALLQDQPLFPALRLSFKAGVHYRIALVVLFAPLLVPTVIGALVASVAAWAGYAVQVILNAIALPVVAASLYCSYRSVFPPPGTPVARKMARVSPRVT